MFAVGFIDENEYEDTIRYFVALVEELRYEINLLKEVKDA
jgi:DNA-binding MltR family transcriptional regulator